MAEPLMRLQDQEEQIEELRGHDRGRVLTFPEAFGFKTEDEHGIPKPSQADLEELEVPMAITDEVFTDFDGVEIPGGDEHPGMDLSDQRAHYEVGVALPENIKVNGIELTAESPLRNLRAARAFYNIGQSGGKAKCFARLLDHQKKLELLLAKDLAAQGRAFEGRIHIEQVMAKVPTEEEKKRHYLTHLPYAAWCPSCIKHRAKQDQHRRTGKSHEQGVPAICFDFCRVRATGSGAYCMPGNELSKIYVSYPTC